MASPCPGPDAPRDQHGASCPLGVEATLRELGISPDVPVETPTTPLAPETLAGLRRLAELARDLPGGNNWLHGEVADGAETVSEWMDKCSADPGAPAAGRLHLVWSEGSGETEVIVHAIVGDTETAPIRAAFMANANPAVVLALLDATAERDALAELRRLREAATPDVAECDLDAAARAARNEFYGADRGPEATSEWRWVVVAALNAIKAARPGGTVAEAVPARRESPDVTELRDQIAGTIHRRICEHSREECIEGNGNCERATDSAMPLISTALALPDLLNAAAERDALAAAVERVRALPVGPPSGGYYMVSMRDVRAVMDGGES